MGPAADLVIGMLSVVFVASSLELAVHVLWRGSRTE